MTAPIVPVHELRVVTDRILASRPSMLTERGDRMCQRMMQRVVRVTREAYDRVGHRRATEHVVTQVRAAYVRIVRLNPEVADDEPRWWLTDVTNALLAEIGRDPLRPEELLP